MLWVPGARSVEKTIHYPAFGGSTIVRGRSQYHTDRFVPCERCACGLPSVALPRTGYQRVLLTLVEKRETRHIS